METKQKKVKPRKTFPKGLLGTSDEFTSSHSASAASGANRTNSSLPRRSESSRMLFQNYDLATSVIATAGSLDGLVDYPDDKEENEEEQTASRKKPRLGS